MLLISMNVDKSVEKPDFSSKDLLLTSTFGQFERFKLKILDEMWSVVTPRWSQKQKWAKSFIKFDQILMKNVLKFDQE